MADDSRTTAKARCTPAAQHSTAQRSHGGTENNKRYFTVSPNPELSSRPIEHETVDKDIDPQRLAFISRLTKIAVQI
jgi:hypothetical protein